MDELDENVLNIQQRQKRAMEMRKNKPKIEIARERAKKKIAPEANIKKRAYAMARQLIRNRLTNVSQAEYAKMGPSEKMAIDRIIEKKGPAIKKLALRLIPKVKKAEYARLQSYMHGHAMANHGAPEGNHVSEELNNLFVEYFGDSAPGNTGSTGERSTNPITSSGRKVDTKSTKSETQGNAKGGSKTKGSPIVQYGKFGEDLEVDSSAFKGLVKKADKSGIDLEILGEVYNRGLDVWVEGYNVTPTQYAFARVNSYINQGKTYFNEDADLHEAMTSWSGKGLLGKMRAANKAFKRGAAGWDKGTHDVSTVKAATKTLSPEQKTSTLNAKAGKGSPLELQQKLIKRDLRKEEVELQEDEAPFKKGETLYLKTKKFANSPHSGQVVRVTPTHVHLKTLGGTGTYKAPHASVTKDRKQSYLYTNYSEKNEEADLQEMKTVTNKAQPKTGTIKIGGKEHSYRKYGWGLHQPFYGPLKDGQFKSKSEMKAAMLAHPAYNDKLKEDLDEAAKPGAEHFKTKPIGGGEHEVHWKGKKTPYTIFNGSMGASGYGNNIYGIHHKTKGLLKASGTLQQMKSVLMHSLHKDESKATLEEVTEGKEVELQESDSAAPHKSAANAAKKGGDMTGFHKNMERYHNQRESDAGRIYGWRNPITKKHSAEAAKHRAAWKSSSTNEEVELDEGKEVELHDGGPSGNIKTATLVGKHSTPDHVVIRTHNYLGKPTDLVIHKAWIKEEVELEESKNTPSVTAFFEKGQTKQNSWKATNKHGHVKHFGLPFKKAAEKHAYGVTNEEVESVDEDIVKVKDGYRLVSKSTGKNLGTYPTKEGAEKRERQVQYFKHQNEEVDLDEVYQNDITQNNKLGSPSLGKPLKSGHKHIGTLPNGHEVHFRTAGSLNQYRVIDPKTRKVNTVLTTKPKSGGAEEIDTLAGNEDSGGAHHLYQHLVLKHDKVLSSVNQSAGARKVWARASSHRSIGTHGYDPKTKTAFHAKPDEDEHYSTDDEYDNLVKDRDTSKRDKRKYKKEIDDVLANDIRYIVMHKKGNLKEDLESYLSELTLPKGYTKGLTPAEIKAKKAHIERNSKLSDRNPDAYKDMPGDKRIREKGIPQSKYTKAYHAKFGESVESLDEDALADKAKKSGISLGTLKKVYRRGVAAWNSGHRPGTTPQQWGMARVNSYITKGKTYHTSDKDLREDDNRPIAVSRGMTPRKKNQNVERDSTPQTTNNDSEHPKNPESDMNKHQQIMKKIIDEFEFSAEELDFFLEHGVEFGELLDEAVNPTKRQTKKLISRWHDKEQGQMYGDRPYSYHPKKVMNIGKRVFGSSRFGPATKKVALLHDTLEDTPHTPEDLAAKGFTPEVINAVKLLSKDKKLSYRDNIERIIRSGNRHAQMVKYADNMANYTGDKSGWDPEKRKASQAKYMDSMRRLGAVLGVNHHEKLEEGSVKPSDRLIGTDSLVKTYKKDTPGQNLDEAFNIAFAAGIGQTYTAADLGMKMQGGFAYHPSVLDEIEEDVVEADKAPVVVAAHKDAYGNVIPAKTVMRKLNRKIIKSGNVHDGDTDQPIGESNNG